jgi:hypothetical protein
MKRPSLRVYSIHLPPPYSGKDQEPEALREGFSVTAFLLTVLWALAHRLWLRAALLVAIAAVLAVSGYMLGLNLAGQAIVTLGFMVWVGTEGNDWQRDALARRGWRDGGVIAADSDDAAIRRYWDLAAVTSGVPGPPSLPETPGETARA